MIGGFEELLVIGLLTMMTVSIRMHFAVFNQQHRPLMTGCKRRFSGFSPPKGRFAVTVQDEQAGATRALSNRRFNCHALDSPLDLLARERRMVDWYGRFTGPLYLQCPRIDGVTRGLHVAVISIWGPAFSVVSGPNVQGDE